MPLYSGPGFPGINEDSELLEGLGEIPVRPIFIMGLHRSGTTFLYDCIARSFPLAQLSLYHLFYYHRLLVSHRDGSARRDRERLDKCFRARGIANRKIDRVAVNADEVEEYGFLLRRHSGSFRLGPGNAALFGELCRKLLAVQPGSRAVLLKNPWDTGNAAWILERFPEARFVYIHRDPIAVLNSMLNALQSYLDGPQPYLEMLLSTDGSRRGYRAGYALWWLLRGLRALVGRRGMALLFRGRVARALARQVAAYRADLQKLPPGRAIELDYDELVANPEATMLRLQVFFNFPLTGATATPAVRRRNYLNPVLKNYRDRLDGLLAEIAG
ncbi:sulfotransferase family protein [Microbulbifer halophilus]|uniref:Sulfotransferase family protein n=1 Tax=Microbulbifer halophilus TaxID=453963 RepID=A0ABW5ECJ8_9GAMM|nr:sulfotransferase [Microbulbifer halophilus]MCW8126029.1 sulfotransferase [Microbulbifer halophilus]